MGTRILNRARLCRLTLFIALIGAAPARLPAQVVGVGEGALAKTTLGQSQNDYRDLQNSLIPGEKKYGKGEKKVEVNTAELQTSKAKDTTFGGSLMNMGISRDEPKLDASKVQRSTSEKETVASKQPATTSTYTQSETATADTRPTEAQGSFLNLADTAMLGDELSESGTVGTGIAPGAPNGNAAGGEAQKQEQTADSKADQKTSTASSDKPGTTKPDGDH